MVETETPFRDLLGFSGDGLELSDLFLLVGPVLLVFGLAFDFAGYGVYGGIIFSLGLFALTLTLSGKAIIFALAYFD